MIPISSRLLPASLCARFDLSGRDRPHPRSPGPGKSASNFAFRLSPDSGEAHVALGWHLYWGYADYDRARAELAVAQQSLPNNPRVFELAGLIDRRQRRWTEAARILSAHVSSIHESNYLVTLGTTYFWLHDYDQMARVMDRSNSLGPDSRLARMFRAPIELRRKRTQDLCGLQLKT